MKRSFEQRPILRPVSVGDRYLALTNPKAKFKRFYSVGDTLTRIIKLEVRKVRAEAK